MQRKGAPRLDELIAARMLKAQVEVGKQKFDFGVCSEKSEKDVCEYGKN